MKKVLLLAIGAIIILSVSVNGQNSDQPAGIKKKADQSKLYNEVFAGYGIGSLYIFIDKVNHSYSGYPSTESYNASTTDASSAGTFMMGYNRMLNRVVMIGFSASYFNVNYSTKYSADEYSPGYVGTVDYNDNLLNGMAKFTFNYVNKPMVRVYSSVGLGITVDISTAQGRNAGDLKQTAKKILPSGQLTFMGVRFGREIGGFCEFGFLTNSIISAGINYQFGD